jgi:hypothetical protein
MAYQTGVASSATNLVSIIQTFAQTNGFTLTDNILHTANSWTKLIASTATLNPTGTDPSEEYQFVGVAGGLDTTFAANTSPLTTIGGQTFSAAITIPTALWPVSYHLFYNGTPSELFCVINYNVNYYQHLSFGEILKSSSLYTGGGFCHATCSAYTIGNNEGFVPKDMGFDFDTYRGYGVGGFFSIPYYTYINGRNSYVYTSSNSYGWGSATISAPNNAAWEAVPTVTNLIAPLITRLPNTWNDQTVLLPCRLTKAVSATYVQDLGSFPWIRYTRMDYLAPGDIITLGAEQWKVFPLFAKNSTYRDGYSACAYYNGQGGTVSQPYHTGPQTGTYALAYKYTP